MHSVASSRLCAAKLVWQNAKREFLSTECITIEMTWAKTSHAQLRVNGARFYREDVFASRPLICYAIGCSARLRTRKTCFGKREARQPLNRLYND